MEVYLMRHAIASERGLGEWKSDRERPLTDEGIKKMTRAARGLAAAGISFDRILTSPFVRARDTARIVAESQGTKIEIEEIDELASGFETEALFRVLRKIPDSTRLLLVGHEPDLGRLAARLIGLPASRALPFKKGGSVRIDLDGMPPSRPGTLVWMLTPSLARSLGD